MSTEPAIVVNEKDEIKEYYEPDKTSQVAVDTVSNKLIEEFQFTWRASIVGSLLGCLVGK
jgi:hypothetical protein